MQTIERIFMGIFTVILPIILCLIIVINAKTITYNEVFVTVIGMTASVLGLSYTFKK